MSVTPQNMPQTSNSLLLALNEWLLGQTMVTKDKQ